jgi:C-terminal processing protease CtpA/Prc
MRLGLLAEARLGPFVLRDVPSAFSRERGGILAATEFDGVLGSEVLSRFRVTFDYARSRLVLEPNASLRAGFERDASGLSLVAPQGGGRGLRVFGVVPDSPAAEAGIARSDTILRVDGRSVSAPSLPRVRALLRVSGRTHRLRVLRDGAHRTVTIRLRSLL